jgi:hypothetical protein
MRFECGDLDRALAQADLMPEAREHLKSCAACRREYRLWNDISSGAKALHEQWDTPALWPEIRKAIEAEPKPPVRLWRRRPIWAIAAAVIAAVSLSFFLRSPQAKNQPAAPATTAAMTGDFLTEQALSEVEKSEAAYRRSIEKLARIAQPKLSNTSSPAAVNTREKLLLLDTAIEDTRANVKINRFNTRLQLTLAGLYREKQQTLEDALTHDKKN